MQKSISIVIPVFNDQSGVDACLAALADQTISTEWFEVIVVDNGSTPPVEDPSFKYGFARRIFCEKPGSYAARNAGIGHANGEKLAFTDADCIPDRNWLENGLAALDENPSTAIGGEVIFIESESPSATELYQRILGFMQKENIETSGFSATANIFLSAEMLSEVGLFSEELYSGGDREWCWRAKGHGISIKFEPTAIVKTLPRKSLKAAIKQSRRVVAGLDGLRNSNSLNLEQKHTNERFTPLEVTKIIFSRNDLSLLSRTRVFLVASTLKLVKVFELVMLRLGRHAERQ